VGILDGEHAVDLLAVHEASPFLSASDIATLGNTTQVISSWDHLKPLFEKGVELSRAGKGRIPIEQATLLAPMTPSTILCSGSNYLSHNQEKANADTSGKEPEFFVKTGDCVVGHNQAIVWDPILTKKLDGEVELAVTSNLIRPRDNHKKSHIREDDFGILGTQADDTKQSSWEYSPREISRPPLSSVTGIPNSGTGYGAGFSGTIPKPHSLYDTGRSSIALSSTAMSMDSLNNLNDDILI
jgi:hypothetical protein